MRARTILAASAFLACVTLPDAGAAQQRPGGQRGLRLVRPMPRVEITPYLGWQFGGGLTTTIGELDLRAAMNWGGIVGLRVSPEQVVELSYNHQRAPLVREPGSSAGSGATVFDVTSHFVHLGGRAERSAGPLRPFLTGGLGLTVLDPSAAEFGSETRFSVHFGGGVLLPFSARAALRTQLRGWYSFLSTTGGVFCSPQGCAFGLGGNGILQGDVSAGLTIGL